MLNRRHYPRDDMSKTYANIAKQIETLQKQANDLRKKELAEVIAGIKEAMAVYGLTAEDIGLGRKKRGPKPGAAKKAGRKGASSAKYSDGAGNTWGGRGPRPLWLREALDAGKALEDFLA